MLVSCRLYTVRVHRCNNRCNNGRGLHFSALSLSVQQLKILLRFNWDQVGGTFFEAVLANMNQFGRVSICGQISHYNEKEPTKGVCVCVCTHVHF